MSGGERSAVVEDQEASTALLNALIAIFNFWKKKSGPRM